MRAFGAWRPRDDRAVGARGQSSVELVLAAVLVAAALIGCAQALTAAYAALEAREAARAASRAARVGADPLGAARASVPRPFRRRLTVRERGDRVRVAMQVPPLVPGGPRFRVTAGG